MTTVLDKLFNEAYADLYSEGEPLTPEASVDKELIDIDFVANLVATFAQLISGIKFYSYQTEVSNAITKASLRHKGEVLTLLQARQSGKTEGIANTAISIAVLYPFLAQIFKDDWRFNLTDELGRYRGFKNGIRIGFYAPSLDMVDTPKSRVRNALSNQILIDFMADIGMTWKPIPMGVQFSNGSTITFRSADKKTKIESKTYDIIFLDECQQIDAVVIQKSIRPMVSARCGIIVKVGTAVGYICDYYDTIKTNKRLQMDPSIPQLHYCYPHWICSKENSLFRGWVEQEKSRLGEDSEEFRMSYCCEFTLERGMFVTEKDLLHQACARSEGEFGELWRLDLREYDSPLSLVVGIDFARAMDSTVLTIMAVDWENPAFESPISGVSGIMIYRAFNKHVVAWKEWAGDNYEVQFNEINAFLREFILYSRCQNPDYAGIWVDATGLGAVALDRLDAILPWKTFPFVFSSRSKSDGYKLLSTDILSGRLSFPYSEDARKTQECRSFVAQMLDLKKEWKNNIMVVAHSEGKYARDDYPDSLLLANWGANQYSRPVMIEHMNIFSR